MKILVLNCGSSSVKFELLQIIPEIASTQDCMRLAGGVVDRIGPGASLVLQNGDKTVRKTASVKDQEDGVRTILEWLQSLDSTASGFEAVGHRVVHGGERFTTSVLIDEEIIGDLDSLCELAPLHNPASVSGIRAARAVLGAKTPMAAVFDTAFHRTLPEVSAVYAIPHDLSSKHHIRRYGFHGIAHQYSMLRYAELTGTPVDQLRLVTLHLGNGCSACAIRDGKSVDTSMGFTPLEGLVMGTRSGDLDPALLPYLARQENFGLNEIEDLLNKRSGLLGLSELSSDMRELTAAYETNPRARLAVDVFCHRARKYLGAYIAVLEGTDGVVLSGGIGEHSPLVRQKICANMDWCGLQLDERANTAVAGLDIPISRHDSRIHVFVVHTNEELIIAQETARLVADAGR